MSNLVKFVVLFLFLIELCKDESQETFSWKTYGNFTHVFGTL